MLHAVVSKACERFRFSKGMHGDANRSLTAHAFAKWAAMVKGGRSAAVALRIWCEKTAKKKLTDFSRFADKVIELREKSIMRSKGRFYHVTRQ